MENQIKKKSWINRHPVLTTLGVFVLLGMIISASSDDKTASTPASSNTQTAQEVAAIKLDSETLRQAYKANEVSGDNQYKGKLVEISGTIDSIGKDITDEAYITFETPESYSLDSVQCMFKSSEETQLATLKKGQQITVQGTVSGATIGKVIVRSCKVV
jgi:hypothetical protein